MVDTSSSAFAIEDKKFLSACLALGRQYCLQRRIRNAESVSKVLLKNGIRLASNRDLLAGAPVELEAGREQLASELRATVRRLDAIDALDSARRAGALA